MKKNNFTGPIPISGFPGQKISSYSNVSTSCAYTFEIDPEVKRQKLLKERKEKLEKLDKLNNDEKIN